MLHSMCVLREARETDSTNSNGILAGNPGVLRNIQIWEQEMAKLESTPPVLGWGIKTEVFIYLFKGLIRLLLFF